MLRSASRSFWLLVALLLVHSAWSGWQAPTAAYGQAFPLGALGWCLALVPGVAFAVLGFTRQAGWKQLPYPSLESKADRVLGLGMYRYLFLGAGVFLVLGAAAITTGAVGLVRCLWLGAAESPLLTCGFVLSAGVGMLCAYFAQRHILGVARSDA
jgi:hypothetical protein